MLEKRGYLPKLQLKFQDKLPLCFACQFSTAHQRPQPLRERKVALFENQIKQNQMM
jgi:hypothetical protein